MPKERTKSSRHTENNLAMDEDRMVNEGLAGGNVNMKSNLEQIGAATPMEKESAPRKAR